MSELRNAAELVAACDRWAPGDLPAFANITASALRLLGLYQKDMAREFDVSVATVSRWAAGEAKPHTIVQESVIDFIRRRATKAAAGAMIGSA